MTERSSVRESEAAAAGPPNALGAAHARRATLQVVPFWVAGAIAGLASVFYSRVFAATEAWSRNHLSTEGLFVAAPAALLVSWALVEFIAPEAGGSGIPQLMAASEPGAGEALGARLLSLRVAVVKMLSSSVALLGGAAIGREGPTLQISGAIFRAVHALVPRSWPRVPVASMLLAGGASGLAAAFNTPLGGIVYAIEELARTHISSFRSGVLHAVLVAGLVAQMALGPYLYLGDPRLGPWAARDLPLFLLIGVVAGLAGAIWARALYAAVCRRNRLKRRQRAAVAAFAGLALAALGWATEGQALGTGRAEIENQLFGSSGPAGAMGVAARLLGSFVSFVSGGAGGIFAPALSSGAMLASALGPLAAESSTKLVIVLGMVAFLTGVTRTPFTSFVLVLEMTDRHSALFPMMVAAMAAHAAGHLIDPRSFYERVRDDLMANHAARREGL